MLTIGEQLKLAREARKLTIKQVVVATRVRAHYLQAMEIDDFSAMPSAAQARGFLRLYAEFLGMDSDVLIERLRCETNSGPAPLPQIEILVPDPTPIPEASQPAPPPPQPSLPPPPDPEEAESPLEPVPPAPSQTIFDEIGVTMRNRRELISLTLDEVERHTHVRKHNLELIEAGEFDKLPSPVQLRGTLSAYASFLDLDTDAVLLRYADAIQSRRLERQGSDKPKSSHKTRIGLPLWLRHFISPDLIFGGSMILILLALGIWGAERIFSGETQLQGVPTQGPSISDVLLASPVASPTSLENIPASLLDEGGATSTLNAAQASSNETPVATTSSAVEITVVVLERTFLRVTVDGVVEQDGRAAPGAMLTFDGSSRIEVLTGSGTAVQIIFNQSALGVMGNFGEVVDRIYTINGVETPTPTPSPTPTITPKPSLTLRPSPTLRPSSTLHPTSTPHSTSTIIP
jgi:cytoskeletal protein RodZ